MEFGWTSQQEDLHREVVDLAESLPIGSDGGFSRQVWSTIANSGLLGAAIPQDYGGKGRDIPTTVRMLEGLGYGCRDNGLTLAVNGTIWAVMEPILRFGSEAQKKKYLPALVSGDVIGCHAMTEKTSGSDSFALETTADPIQGGYRLNGTKAYVGMAPVADIAVVFAKTDPDLGSWGISAFVVDLSGDGVSVSDPTEKMGLNSNPLGEIRFDDVLVQEEALLGPEGAGASIFNDSMEWERSFIFASHVGSMARQLEETVDYAKSRKQFGAPIGDNQSVSNRIVDMTMRLEIARLLLYQSAWLKENDQPAVTASALTKLFISEAFVSSSLDAVRVHGGIGYLKESGVEADLRDSVGGVIYSGTSDIQRQVVARVLGL